MLRKQDEINMRRIVCIPWREGGELMESPKPCPFCGSDQLTVEVGEDGCSHVECLDCWGRTGCCVGWDGAVSAWNSRAEPPAAPEDPARYSRGGVECIDAIRAALDPVEYRGFCKGSVLGYVWREKYKGGDRDLGKAGDFIGYALDASEEAGA